MRAHVERMVCPKCGGQVAADDEACPHCDTPLESVVIKRATRGRRYVYGKRKVGMSPEVIWLLIVIAVGIMIIVGAQLYAFMRARKLVLAPPPTQICRAWPAADRAGLRAAPTRPNPRTAAPTLTPRGLSHEIRLRHLCHADRRAGRGHPGPGRHWV